MAKEDKHTVLICWNNSIFGKNIQAQIEEKTGWKAVVCQKRLEFKEKWSKKENWSEITYVIVLCELKWSDTVEDGAYSDMNGIKLAQHLRREDVRIPILFVSFLSRKMILDKHPDAEIICTPALKHGFCQLPVNFNNFQVDENKPEYSNKDNWIKALKDLTIRLKDSAPNFKGSYDSKELTDLELEYTKQRFCGIDGLIAQINHDISGCSADKLQEKLKILRFAVNNKYTDYIADVDNLEIKLHTLALKQIKNLIKQICNTIIHSDDYGTN